MAESINQTIADICRNLKSLHEQACENKIAIRALLEAAQERDAAFLLDYTEYLTDQTAVEIRERCSQQCGLLDRIIHGFAAS